MADWHHVLLGVGTLSIVWACATPQVLEDGDPNSFGFSPDASSGGNGVGASGAGTSGTGLTGAGASPPMGGQGGTNAGGTGATGGSGAGDNGGAPSADGCDPGMKKCGGICIPPTFGTGCRIDTCEACGDPPPNAQGLCESGECSFLCHDGYVLEATGAGCELPVIVGGAGASSTGGTAATGGSGGTSTGGTGAVGGTGATGGVPPATGGTPPATGGTTGGGCNSNNCPSCSLGMSKCCSSSGNCGCAWGGVFPPSCL